MIKENSKRSGKQLDALKSSKKEKKGKGKDRDGGRPGGVKGRYKMIDRGMKGKRAFENSWEEVILGLL